ncbi:MAG: YqgE/AlgH family protein [Verrucomicrobia bacterium]|nr:YqgE/AlgH family protein [Verrucomicrobiota bacterium]
MPGKFKSLKGQFLLDGGKLAGSFFHRTVVLICQHDPEGAFGLIVNRPTDKHVGEALVADLPSTLKLQPLFLGGPVQPQALSYLHADAFLPDANVLPNLQLDHSIDELVELGESFSPTQQLKVFAGYAGWSAGQLDDEMKRAAWLTHPASAELVFGSEVKQLWVNLVRQKGWQYRLLSEQPEDLNWN